MLISEGTTCMIAVLHINMVPHTCAVEEWNYSHQCRESALFGGGKIAYFGQRKHYAGLCPCFAPLGWPFVQVRGALGQAFRQAQCGALRSAFRLLQILPRPLSTRKHRANRRRSRGFLEDPLPLLAENVAALLQSHPTDVSAGSAQVPRIQKHTSFNTLA